ncbi:hypothetical protein [Streptomyces pacificus]|uniref:C2H2-type domain-containing protein n=1 Tax=Streptomyces pacificus TaxID=2705029 RepID=A0A6A0AXR6_9ACTN|nr:hypothetical protein [Streptomyces pacificus]GFH37225.1 hypothetical protein SCWH03_34610 [Streptomyces pacificus]
MTDTAGTRSGAGPLPVGAPETVQESYAFACMQCGYGWEQTYDIEHHIDGAGRPLFTYRVEGRLAPSPLNRLTCPNCGGHKARIMRAGQVSGLAESLRRQHLAPPHFAMAGPVPAFVPEPRTPGRRPGERHIGRYGDGTADGAVSPGAGTGGTGTHGAGTPDAGPLAARAEGAAVGDADAESVAAETPASGGAPRRGLGGMLRGLCRRR